MQHPRRYSDHGCVFNSKFQKELEGRPHLRASHPLDYYIKEHFASYSLTKANAIRTPVFKKSRRPLHRECK